MSKTPTISSKQPHNFHLAANIGTPFGTMSKFGVALPQILGTRYYYHEKSGGNTYTISYSKLRVTTSLSEAEPLHI